MRFEEVDELSIFGKIEREPSGNHGRFGQVPFPNLHVPERKFGFGVHKKVCLGARGFAYNEALLVDFAHELGKMAGELAEELEESVFPWARRVPFNGAQYR